MLTRHVMKGAVRVATQGASKRSIPSICAVASMKFNMKSRTFATTSSTAATPDMFCFQCEQTDTAEDGTRGCTVVGVCGKDPELAALQDVLVHGCKTLASWLTAARLSGASSPASLSEGYALVEECLFATMTNVNFDQARIQQYIQEVFAKVEELRAIIPAGSAPTNPAAHWSPSDPTSIPALINDAAPLSVPSRQAVLGDDVAGLQELIVYAMKGICAYASHARAFGQNDPEVEAFLAETLQWLDGSEEARDLGNLLGRTLEIGGKAVAVMALLDSAHTSNLGHQTPAEVPTVPVPGKSILFSGHDLRDLEALLKQTEGSGVNVYTHGEMLPAHGYPKLRQHKHLVGHYGGPWQLQKMEFGAFPGPIVVSTNCIIKPMKRYADRIYTVNATGYAGAKHVTNRDFSAVIAQAKECDGFTEASANVPGAGEPLSVGFGHHTVLGIAGDVIQAIQDGKITKFAVVGGCDGSETERSAFTDYGKNMKETEVALTLGCGKYRINRLPELKGNVPGTGIPRLLDLGQCNNSVDAVYIAQALAGALDCGVNDLPIDYRISHLEQKAAAVLTALLHLGIKNIQLGPTLPAFITPPVLNVLIDKFNIGAV